MTWKELLIGIPLAIIGGVLLLLTATGMVVTRTDWGKERFRAFAIERINGAIGGHIEIDEVLEGDLLRTVRLAGVRIYEADGDTFARVDTLAVRYRWSDFLLGNVFLQEVTLIGPVVTLATVPDGGWNFNEVFSGTRGDSTTAMDERPSADAERPEASSRRIVLRNVTIRSGDVTLSMPWTPGPGETASTTRWHVEGSGDGWRRWFRLDDFNAELPIARVSGSTRDGWLFQFAEFQALATVIGEPFEVERLSADLNVRGDTIQFDLWEADLANSHIRGNGWVKLSAELRYDVLLKGNPVTARDIRWLLPETPTGVAYLDFRLRDVGQGTHLEAFNARWSSDEAELSGRFGMVFGEGRDRFAFDSVDLEIQRITTGAIESMTGWRSPLPAELEGELALDGGPSRLWMDTRAVVRPDSGGRASRIEARGRVVALEDRLGAVGLDLRFDSLRLDHVRAWVPGLAVRGSIEGSASLDGGLADGMDVRFAIQQKEADLAANRIRGDARVAMPPAGQTRIEATVEAQPVSLTTLARYYPAIPFRGAFRGQLSARGSLDDLDVEANLRGVGDSLWIRGTVQLEDSVPRYEAEVQGWRVRLAEFREGLPSSDLDFRARFEGRGARLPDLQASGTAAISASWIGGVRFDSAVAVLRVSDSRLHVDTAIVRSEFGRLEASGAVSLRPEAVRDSLRFELHADSLGSLNPWLFPTYQRLAPAVLRVTEEAGEEDAATDLQGAALIRGWVISDSMRTAVRGRAEAWRLAYGDWSADTLVVESFDIGRRNGSLRVAGVLRGERVGVQPLRFERAELEGELADNVLSVLFSLSKPGASAVGAVRAEFADSASLIGIDSLTLGLGSAEWTLEEPARVRLAEGGGVEVEDLALTSGPRRIVIHGSMGATGPAAFTADLEGVDLANLSRIWPDSLGIGGSLTLRAELSGRVRDPQIECTFEVTDGRLLGVEYTSLAGEMSYDEGQLSVETEMRQRETQLARLHGTLPLELTLPGFELDFPDNPVRLTLEGDSIPLSFAALISDQIANPGGHARGTVEIGGTVRDLRVDGPLTVSGGTFRIIRTGIVYEGLAGEVAFEGEQMQLRDLRVGTSQGGEGILSGALGLADISDPTFDLDLRARDLPIYDQLDARVVVSGAVQLDGRYRQPIVAGALSVVEGVLYIEEIGRQSQIIDPFAEETGPFGETFAIDQTIVGQRRHPSPFLDNLTLDLDVEVARNTFLRSEEANVEIAGNLRVATRPGQDQMRVDGTLNAIRGDYRFLNKRFQVIEGTIDFVGSSATNPNLRIVAQHTVQTQKEPIQIRLILGGTLEDPTLALESDQQPPIPESDLLSYLLFGRPTYELTRAREQQGSLLEDVTAGVPQALFGYALGSLLVGEAGIAYVDVSRVTPSESEGEYRTGSTPGAVAATQVEVGWYLAPTVFVSVAQHLVGMVRPTVRLEWRLNDNLTLRGVTEPRSSQQGTVVQEGEGSNVEQSIGVFLFYGWSY